MKIADDGEILVRGENVTHGLFQRARRRRREAFEDGWFHTGDIGELDAKGRLFIRGRKKEMIVTPEGLNVFPEDVERVLDAVPGVRGVGGRRRIARPATEERVHAVLVLEPGADADAVVRDANAQLRGSSARARRRRSGRGAELPRTEGTRKLKRAAIRAVGATRRGARRRAGRRRRARSRWSRGSPPGARCQADDDARGARARARSSASS